MNKFGCHAETLAIVLLCASPKSDRLLAENPGDIDCLVLDIQLGGISGIELSERLSATGSRVPAIFLTALDDPALHNRALAAGCAAYFRKTEPGDRLVKSILQAATPNQTTTTEPQ